MIAVPKLMELSWLKQPPEVFCEEACNFVKKETLAQVFSYEFCEISKNTFPTEHLWTTASVITMYLVWIHLYSKLSVLQKNKFS